MIESKALKMCANVFPLLILLFVAWSAEAGCSVIFSDKDKSDAKCPTWRKSIQGSLKSGVDTINSIVVDDHCHVYVCGTIEGGISELSLGGQGGADAFIAHFDEVGAVVWAQLIGGPGADSCNALTLDASGNAYFTATISDARLELGDNGELALEDGPSGTSVLVAAFERDTFVVTWAHTLSSEASYSEAWSTALAVTQDGRQVVVGVNSVRYGLKIDGSVVPDLGTYPIGKYLVTFSGPTADPVPVDVRWLAADGESTVHDLAFTAPGALLVSTTLVSNPSLGSDCPSSQPFTQPSAHFALFSWSEDGWECRDRVVLLGRGEGTAVRVRAGPFVSTTSEQILWTGSTWAAEHQSTDAAVEVNTDDRAQGSPWVYRLQLTADSLSGFNVQVFGGAGNEEVTGIAFDDAVGKALLVERFTGVTDFGVGESLSRDSQTSAAVKLDLEGTASSLYPLDTGGEHLVQIQDVYLRDGISWFAGSTKADPSFGAGGGAFISVEATR